MLSTLSALGALFGVLALALDPLHSTSIEAIFVGAMAAPAGGLVGLVLISALYSFGVRILRRLQTPELRQARNTAAVISALFAFATVLGQSLAGSDSLDGVFTGSWAQSLVGFTNLIGYFRLTFIVVGPLFAWVINRTILQSSLSISDNHGIGDNHSNRQFGEKAETPNFRKLRLWNDRLTTWIAEHLRRATIWAFLAILLVRFIYWVWAFPGIVNPDSGTQISQIIGSQPWSNQHPIGGTLLMGLIIRPMFELFSLTAGIALFTALHMLATTLITVWVLHRLYFWGVPAIYLLCVLAIFMLFPFHSMLAIEPIKDSGMGYALLIYAVMAADLTLDPKARLANWRWVASFGASIFAIVLFRNNGIFVVAAGAIVMLFMYRRYWLRICLAAIVPIIVAIGAVNLMMGALDARPGGITDALGIPLQQIARVSRDAPQSLSADQRTFITQLFDGTSPEQIGELYNPWSLAPINGYGEGPASNQFIRENPGRFIRGWFDIGRQHFQTFLVSFLQGGLGIGIQDNRTSQFLLLTGLSNTA